MPNEVKFDVFEIHGGKSARGHGYDYSVCRTQTEAENILAADMDAMDDGDELKIIFRRYSQAELDDVIDD